MSVGRVKDSTRGGSIREPADVLVDTGERIKGVEPSVHASNATMAISIRGFNVPDISSRIANGRDKAGRFSDDMDTIGTISYFPSSIKITQGWGGASRSTIIYTIASIRLETPSKVGFATRRSQERMNAVGGSLAGFKFTADPKSCSSSCS